MLYNSSSSTSTVAVSLQNPPGNSVASDVVGWDRSLRDTSWCLARRFIFFSSSTEWQTSSICCNCAPEYRDTTPSASNINSFLHFIGSIFILIRCFTLFPIHGLIEHEMTIRTVINHIWIKNDDFSHALIFSWVTLSLSHLHLQL